MVAEALRRRLGWGFGIVALGIFVSALSDEWLRPDPYAVHVVQAVQLALVAALYGWYLHSPLRTELIAVVGLSVICVTGATAGAVNGDHTTPSLLLIPLLTGAATLLPWSPRSQLVVALVALLSILGNLYYVTGGIDLSTSYPMLVAGGLTFASLVFVSGRLKRDRENAAAIERARTSAELALRQAHADLERRVGERTQDLYAANVALREEIAERERAQAESLLHQAELAQVARLATMGQMAAEMAHELNQPLAAITAYSQGSARRLRAGAATAEILPPLEEIALQGLRAGEIIQRMTAFARNPVTSFAPADLRDVVHAACRQLESAARRDGVAIRLELGERALPVHVDALQIEHVVTNLVRNALQAVANHSMRSRSLRISAAALVDASCAEITVADSGPGIAPEVAARIFEPFFSTKPGGLGLGLAASRAIVEAHGGRLWLDDSPITTFRLVLPWVGQTRISTDPTDSADRSA